VACLQRQLQLPGRVQPSIVAVRRTPIGPLALALVLALALARTASASPLVTLREDGSAFVREDRYLPADTIGRGKAAAPAPGALRATVASVDGAPRRTVRGELARLLAEGAIDQETAGAYGRIYADALKTRKKLRGTRRAALSATLGNLEDIAAQGELNASRLPALFQTVARNRQWWSSGPLLRYGARVSFQGSRLVWQHYTGQGLQIQWLGTFGKANALWQSRTHDDDLRALLDEALGMAAQRAGGIAFEYLFRFDGGRPPWVSGLAHGTAVQALSRAAIRLNESRFFASARAGLGIFREGPPGGVRVATPAGAHYLIYSFAPGMRVLNAFTQALNGLHEFAVLANDAEGRALFEAGERQLRAELPAYDTGAWSRYSTKREADLGYHKIARDFLRNLCARLTEDRDRVMASAAQVSLPAPPGAPGGPTGGTPPAPPATTGGGTPPAGALGAPAPVADPDVYCGFAQRFTSYLSKPPVLKLVSRLTRAGKPAALKLTVSKPAFVTLTVKRRGRAVASMSGRFASGIRALRWAKPRAAGVYSVALRATDVAGNNGSAGGRLRVLKARKRR
jgi:hypothetical protein